MEGQIRPSLSRQAVYTAAMLSFTIVARVSEYLQTDTSAHMLTATEIVFQLPDGQMLPSHQAYKNPTSKPVAVSILIRSKKNDKRGRGFKYYFQATNPEATYCITSIILWDYTSRARPSPGRSFFHIPELNWTLKPPYFATRLKQLGVHFELDPSRISSIPLPPHWGRNAAGFTDGDIRGMGD